MKKIIMIATVAAAALFSANSYAEQATVAEVEAGCPVNLPTINTAINDNFGGKVQVLDRSSLSQDCLAKIYEQNGDDRDADEGADDQ